MWRRFHEIEPQLGVMELLKPAQLSRKVLGCSCSHNPAACWMLNPCVSMFWLSSRLQCSILSLMQGVVHLLEPASWRASKQRCTLRPPLAQVLAPPRGTVPYPLLKENTLVLSDQMTLLRRRGGRLELSARVGDVYPNQVFATPCESPIPSLGHDPAGHESIQPGTTQEDQPTMHGC